MIWQDLVLSTGLAVSTLGLLPTVVGQMKPSPKTALVSAVVTGAFIAVDCSLGLWLATALSLVDLALWWTIFWQALLVLRVEPHG